MRLLVKKLHPDAVLYPPRHAGDVGYDLAARLDESLIIQPGELRVIPTGIAVQIPEWHEGQVRPRSSMMREGLTAELGTIDAGYRGEVKVVLHNRGTVKVVAPDMRIAQLVISPVVTPEIVEVEELGETSRGGGGFGSTGK